MASAERYHFDRASAPLEWHEAVAVVQEVATRAIAGENVIARRAGDLAIDPDGRLILPEVGPAVPVFGALKAARDTQNLTDLRALLHDLLPDTTIPPALAVLADPANGQAGVTSIADFSKALSFFERPNRARDLKVVAARLGAATEQLTLKERLADLTRKARSEDGSEPNRPEPTPSIQPPAVQPAVSPAAKALAPSTPPPPSGEPEPGWDFLSEAELEKHETSPLPAERKVKLDFKKVALNFQNVLPDPKTTALVAGVLCLLMVVAVGGYALMARATAGDGTDAAAAKPERKQPVANLAVEKTTGSAAASKARSSNASSSTAPAPQTRKPANIDADRTARSAPTAAVTITTPDGNGNGNGSPAALASRSPNTPAPAAAMPPVFIELTRAPRIGGQPLFLASGLLDSAVPSWDSVYDGQDSQVQPARLLRPQLPEIPPGTSIETLGMFEFVVSMRGTVERIRLVRSPADRQYRDFMLMPAAKAWIFQPASRDGLPVRYRMRIPIPQ
jgi:hypothetical protein